MFPRKVVEMAYITSDEDDLTDDDDVSARNSSNNKADSNNSFMDNVPDDRSTSNLTTGNEPEPCVRLRFDLAYGGVKVEMPVRPYPCQESIIAAIIEGCRTQQHCLLESPTGSGKTLALLCGSLAWQTDYANPNNGTGRRQD